MSESPLEHSDQSRACNPEVSSGVELWPGYFAGAIDAAMARYEQELSKISGRSNITFEGGARQQGRLIEIGEEGVMRTWDQSGKIVEQPNYFSFGGEMPFQQGESVKVMGFEYKEGGDPNSLLSHIRAISKRGTVISNGFSPVDTGWENDGDYYPRIILDEDGAVPMDNLVVVSDAERDKKALVQRLALVDEFRNNYGQYGLPSRQFFEGNFVPSEVSESIEPNPSLDQYQNEAFRRAMDIDNNPILLLHGPPGSGKSTTTTEIINGHLAAQRKVLLLSHSNPGAQIPALMLQKVMRRQQAASKTFVAGNNRNVIDQRLWGRRIKKNFPPFPDAELTAIKGLKDLQLENYLRGRPLNEGISGEDIDFLPEPDFDQDSFDDDSTQINLQDIHELREALISLALEPFAQATSQATEDLTKGLEKGGLVVSTFGTAINDEILAAQDFDVVIVDEATRMEMPDVIYALQQAGKQIIFVGDPLQLGNIPPEPHERDALVHMMANVEAEKQTITHAVANALGEKVDSAWASPFAHLILSADDPEKELPYVMLKYNRRSLPNIVHVLSELIYDGKMIVDESTVESDKLGTVKWFDTSALQTAQEQTSGTSKENKAEADLIADHVASLLRSGECTPEDIGVIATYKSQAELILKRVRKKLAYSPRQTEKDWIKALEDQNSINTVDAFQGDERKVIMVSMTRSNDEGEIGFLQEEKRIGVAIGRAQEELYVYGDSNTLSRGDSEASEFFAKLDSLISRYGTKEAVTPEALAAAQKQRKARSGHKGFRRRKKQNKAA